jgi:molybdenum cofactor biosynthesis enzyme
MVDVSHKTPTHRTAHARSIVLLPPSISSLFVTNTNASNSVSTSSAATELMSAKGPVLATAIIAGTQAVKRTSDLIPFCHPLPIDGAKFTITLRTEPSSSIDDSSATSPRVIPSPSLTSSQWAQGWRELVIDCQVRVYHKTGVEMEALTGASVAALTVYDMCKALSHDIIIADTRLISKTGGKSGAPRL